MSAAVRDSLLSAEKNCAMFDRIAQRYDAVNRVISLGMDKGWRRKTVELLQPFRGGRFLDVGTGTGELAFEILLQSAKAQIDGIDMAEQMLAIAKRKAAWRGMEHSTAFFTADSLNLPMENNTYDGIVSGFCLRNVEHRQKALHEMMRVLKPGGILAILEAAYPENAFVRLGYRPYMLLIRFIGACFGGGTAYNYLVESIEDFVKPGVLKEMLAAAGCSEVQHRPLTCGAVSIFSGRK